MEKLAPNVASWCRRTHAPQHPLSGDFLAGDEIPQTLIPLLEMFAREHLPILLDTVQYLQDWAKDNVSGTEVPRALGVHAFQIDGVNGTRAVIPYSLWMLQRVTDHLDSLSGDDKAAAIALLESIGAGALAKINIPRLARKNFKLILA